jgi:hypothetical protein
MPRSAPPAAEPAACKTAHTINENAVYFSDNLRSLLRFRATTLRHEVRAGRLRVGKRGGRYYVLGRWLLEWLREGEMPRRQAAPGARAAKAD